MDIGGGLHFVLLLDLVIDGIVMALERHLVWKYQSLGSMTMVCIGFYSPILERSSNKDKSDTVAIMFMVMGLEPGNPPRLCRLSCAMCEHHTHPIRMNAK